MSHKIAITHQPNKRTMERKNTTHIVATRQTKKQLKPIELYKKRRNPENNETPP